jgi:hypothetical protein
MDDHHFSYIRIFFFLKKHPLPPVLWEMSGWVEFLFPFIFSYLGFRANPSFFSKAITVLESISKQAKGNV